MLKRVKEKKWKIREKKEKKIGNQIKKFVFDTEVETIIVIVMIMTMINANNYSGDNK